MTGSVYRTGRTQLRAAGCWLDAIEELIDWTELEARCAAVAAASGEGFAWPPLALFRALLLASWHDLSESQLAYALEDRASFRRFCGFAATEPTPDGGTLIRFRAELIGRDLERFLYALVGRQFEAKGVTVRMGAMVDASLIGSAWIEHVACDGWIERRSRCGERDLSAMAGSPIGLGAEPAYPPRERVQSPIVGVADGGPYAARGGTWDGLKQAIVDRLLVERAYVLGRRSRAPGLGLAEPIGAEPACAETPVMRTRLTSHDAMRAGGRDSASAVPRSRPLAVIPPIAKACPPGGPGEAILAPFIRAQIAATLVSLSIMGMLAIATLWR